MANEQSGTLMVQDLFGVAEHPYVPAKTMNAELAQRMRELSRPDMVRIAPNKHAWVPAAHVKEPPRFCLCRWSKSSEGNFSPIPVAGRWVRITEELVASLGFQDGRRRRRWETLMRLGRAGYIDILHLSPGCWMLDLDSWFRHLAACADDPDMWDEGSEDRDNYLHVNGLGGWKKKLGKKTGRKP